MAGRRDPGGRVYFDVWTKQRETFYIFHADYLRLAEEARRAMDEGRTVVIQSQEYKHPTVVFLEPFTTDALWTAGASVFVVPGRATEVLYLWPRSSNSLRAPIRAAMEGLVETVDEIENPFGRALLHIGRLRQEVWAEENEAAASFAGQVEVLDWSLPESARRNEPLEVLVRNGSER